MTEAAPLLYTSRAQIEAIFTIVGVDMRIDDDFNNTISATEETYLDAVIEEATDLINQYLLPYYTAEDLFESRWIQRRASYIACYYLAMRRGNPRQFGDRYDSILAELQAISQGPGIPGNPIVPRISLRKTFGPMWVNPEIDDRCGIYGDGYHSDPLQIHDEGPAAVSQDTSGADALLFLLTGGGTPLVGRGV